MHLKYFDSKGIRSFCFYKGGLFPWHWKDPDGAPGYQLSLPGIALHTHYQPSVLKKLMEGKALMTIQKLGLRVRGCHPPYIFYVCEGKTVKGTLNYFLVTFHSFKLVIMGAV